MSTTVNLSITEVVANQNNLDVTVNTALETIDSWIGSKANACIMIPQRAPTSITGATLGSNNQVSVFKIFIYHTITVASISFYVSTAVSGKFASVGIYSADGNTRLIDGGPKSTTSTGIQTTALGTVVTLYPGIYWSARTSNDATVAITGVAVSDTGLVAIMNATTAMIGTGANASSAGQLPSTLGAITGSAQTVGVIKLQS